MSERRWKAIAEFPAYEVSDDGLVRRNGRTLKPRVVGKGYYRVQLCRNNKRKFCAISRLVAQAFLPPSDRPCVAHGNGIKTDNRVSNLRWATHKENDDDKTRHGTRLIGDTHPHRKLSAADIPIIRARLAKGEGCRSIGCDFGVSRVAICHIKAGRNWRHV